MTTETGCLPDKQTGGVEPHSRRSSATPRGSKQSERKDVSSTALIEVEMSNQWSLSEQMAENPLANSGGAS